MHLLGVNLPDRKLIKVGRLRNAEVGSCADLNVRRFQIALTQFHGISHSTSRLICARLAFHDRLAVSDLTEPQVNQLSALLSSPATFMANVADDKQGSTEASTSTLASAHQRLANLVIESDLRRQVRADIAHHRTVGSYVGRRHAMSLPVRGQRTKTNAKMARRLNKTRVEKRTFSTATAGPSTRS